MPVEAQLLVVQIAVILLVARAFGWVLGKLGQPQVVGEMIAGLVLGPSVFGLMHGGAWLHTLFPPSSMIYLNIPCQFGVILFMFLVGLEMDPGHIRGQGRLVMATGTVGILVPFACGAGLGWVLATNTTLAGLVGGVPDRLTLMLFMGVAMSITAFPVLARILTERNLHRTRLGQMAISCSAVDDVTGWCILAFVVAVAKARDGAGAGVGDPTARSAAFQQAAWTVGLTAAYALVMVLVAKRLLAQFERQYERNGQFSIGSKVLILILIMASSLVTERIGIHAIFGAFLLGVIMPKQKAFVAELSVLFKEATVLFLLPLFFAYTGLRTELNLLGGGAAWALCGVIVLVAIGGKLGGVTTAARAFGLGWTPSLKLGTLMNTRGLMELIVLNIGLDLGVLPKPLFAMMVLMALVTTFMTTPLLQLMGKGDGMLEAGAVISEEAISE